MLMNLLPLHAMHYFEENYCETVDFSCIRNFTGLDWILFFFSFLELQSKNFFSLSLNH